jgi:hypothetical protein
MIVCFSCSPHTKGQLDQLVASGDYGDHSQAIAAAIQNLTIIHSELGGAASLVIERAAPALSSETDGLVSPSTSQSNAVTGGRTSRARNLSSVPPLFQLPAEISQPPQFATSQKSSSGKVGTVDEWMFGQFNRLLPAKVTCRALVSMIAKGEDRQPLEKLSKSIANEAAKLGQYLAALDEKRHLGRDDAIAIAFPKHPSEFKSVQRFANQFVASANKEGEFSGLGVSLKLIGRHPSNAESISLTEAGWQFGLMENPLLDGTPASNFQKFTDEEISFLLDYIAVSVPAEASAYRTILIEVARGALTPDDLDAALMNLPGHSKKTRRQYVSTQRSGAICRMADLDLIGRSRTGTRVSYVLTPRGKDFLRSAKPGAADKRKSARA